jgi:hypothetical protein
MINPSMISYFPSWCRRWSSFRPKRKRGNGTTCLLAIAGAAAMDSFVGQVWLGDGCESISIEPMALDYIAREKTEDSSVMTIGNQPVAN